MRARFLKPETPIYGLAIAAATVVLGLLAIVLWSTFQKGLPGVESHFSFSNYKDVLLEPFTFDVARNTLVLGAGATTLNLLWSLPMAWLINRTNIPFKNLFLTLMFLPIMIPGFLKAMGWIMLLSPRMGLVNQTVRNFIPVEEGPFNIYSMPGLMFIEGLGLTTMMFFMISAAFQSVDPAFEEAAETTGASRFRIFCRVTLPLVMPAIVASYIYNFMTQIAVFDTPALLGRPGGIYVFSTTMYYLLHPDAGFPNYGAAGVYGLLVLIPTMIALLYYQRMLRLGHRYATVTGKGYKMKLTDLGRFKWVGVAFIGFFLTLDFVLPLLSLAWASFLPHLQLPSMAALGTLSLEGYRSATTVLFQGKVIANTAVVIGSSVLVGLLISIAISWVVLRTRFPGRMALDTVAMVPHAVPGITFAFAIAYIGLVVARFIPFYGSLAALILAYTVGFISFGTRAINGALIQIHKELEEAVLTCGSSKIVAIRKVLLPLLTPVFFYVAVWKGLLAFREVTKALFLQSPRNVVMSTLIWQVWQNADSRTAAALGMLMVVAVGSVIGAILARFPQIMRRGMGTRISA